MIIGHSAGLACADATLPVSLADGARFAHRLWATPPLDSGRARSHDADMTITIRPTARDDFTGWNRLWQAYLEFYESSVDDAVTRTSFDRLTDPTEPMGSFLAHSADGRAVGMVNWVRHRSTWTTGDYCYLQDLYADRDVRGTGIGRLLIEAVYGVASEMGCSRVLWLTHETNQTAMLLYDRIADRSGFVQYRKVL